VFKQILFKRILRLAAAAAVGLTFCAGLRPATAQANALTLGLSKSGLTSLRYAGTQLLAQGEMSVQKATLTGPSGISTDGAVTPTGIALDVPGRKITQTFPWGAITCRYALIGSRLNLTVAVTNSSPLTLQQLTLQLLAIRFPAMPRGWVPNSVHIGSNTGDPTVITADYGGGELAVCNEDVAGKPLLLGFPGRADFSSRSIVVSTAPGWVLSPYLDRYIARPITPGATDVYRLSLRFGASGVPAEALAGDLFARFARAYPQTLRWADRRAIGTLHLAVSETQYHSGTNPRGWFMDPRVDVTTPAGIAAFRKRVLAYADGSVSILKKMNAQGMITWDVEGEQYPQATTYIGDPRLLPTLAPEMDGVADAYFQRFRAAHLRTGLCIRPQRLVQRAGGADQQELTGSGEIAQLLYDKIAYAHKRWGCTLFYVDSNGDPNVPSDPAIFQRLTQRLTRDRIEALIMPEHKNTRYYAYTAPYAELRLGATGTPGPVRAAYARAFTSVYVPDGPLRQDHDALVAAVRRGDILMFRAWWDDPQNAPLRGLYRDAGK